MRATRLSTALPSSARGHEVRGVGDEPRDQVGHYQQPAAAEEQHDRSPVELLPHGADQQLVRPGAQGNHARDEARYDNAVEHRPGGGGLEQVEGLDHSQRPHHGRRAEELEGRARTQHPGVQESIRCLRAPHHQLGRAPGRRHNRQDGSQSERHVDQPVAEVLRGGEIVLRPAAHRQQTEQPHHHEDRLGAAGPSPDRGTDGFEDNAKHRHGHEVHGGLLHQPVELEPYVGALGPAEGNGRPAPQIRVDHNDVGDGYGHGEQPRRGSHQHRPGEGGHIQEAHAGLAHRDHGGGDG